MSYGYSYEYYGTGTDYQLFMEMFTAIMTFALVFSGIFLLVFYILNAVALTGLSKNRGLPNHWIAWIPFADGYAIGRLSDDINLRRGKKTSQRIVLLVMEILIVVFIVVLLAIMLPFFFELMELGLSGRLDYYSEAEVFELMKPFLVSILVIIALFVVEIIYMVFQYIALYNIYKSYARSNAVVFLVLSILFAPITTTIFLLMIKNRTPEDLQPPMGYPPYPNMPYQGYPPYQPYQQYVPSQQYYVPSGQPYQANQQVPPVQQPAEPVAPPQAPESSTQNDSGQAEK